MLREAGRPCGQILLRLDNPAFVPDLLQFLERRGAIVSVRAEDELEVDLIGSYGSRDAIRMDLYLLLRAWEAGRSDRQAEIVD